MGGERRASGQHNAAMCAMGSRRRTTCRQAQGGSAVRACMMPSSVSVRLRLPVSPSRLALRMTRTSCTAPENCQACLSESAAAAFAWRLHGVQDPGGGAACAGWRQTACHMSNRSTTSMVYGFQRGLQAGAGSRQWSQPCLLRDRLLRDRQPHVFTIGPQVAGGVQHYRDEALRGASSPS